MSPEELAVSAPTQEPHGQLSQPPPLHNHHPSTTPPQVIPEQDTTIDETTTTDYNENEPTDDTTPSDPINDDPTEPTTTDPNEQDTNESSYTHYPPPPRQKNHARFIWNNTNSLQTESQPELEHKLTQYQSYDPTVIGIIEPNRNWSVSDKTIKPLQTTMNVLNQDRAKITTAHYREEHSSKLVYQPGGVAQIVLKPLSNRIDSIASDKLGRWSRQEIRLDGSRSLFVYTAYRPCKAPLTSKKTTTWDQQVRGLIKRGISDPDPRKQFFSDLTKELNRLKQEGHLYIIGLDINSRHDDDDVLDFLADTDLVDLFDDFYHTRPPTYTRSKNTMDMVLGSLDILQWTVNAYIFDPHSGPGDHSVIGIDLNYGGMIGREDLREIDQTAFQSRLLTSTDQKATKAYLKQVTSELEEHNVRHRFETLIERCDRTSRCTPDDERIFQALCTQLYAIAKRAESNCKRVGPKPWSTTLASVGQALQIARKEFYRLVRGGVPSNQSDDKASAIAGAKANLDTATAMIAEAKQNAATLREAGLQLLAEQYAEEHSITKATALKQLLRKERLSQIYRKLGYHISGKYYDPLKKLLIPDDPTDIENTSWTALLEAEAIWEALLHQGKEHFSQASDTPFATGPIADLIGPFEQNEHSQHILHGTFDIDSLTDDIEVRAIVRAMMYQNPNCPPGFDCTITIEQLLEQFKKAKESIASSPKGLHYGHWKTLTQNPDAFFPYASMICFAFKWGIPPTTWETAVQPLIEKDQGSPKINRLRRIVLLDAGMNMGFRIIFGHRMMKMATKMNILSPHQFGSRSGHNALGCVLLKRLSYDTARLLVALLCVFDCDATACFDRMIPSQCMILGKRTGVQDGPIDLHLKVCKRMKYHVKTAYGVSPGSFSTSLLLLILGMMQGSAAVGAFWALSSSLLLAVLQQRHKPTRFPSPREGVYTERNGEANVDDTALWKLSLDGTIAALVQATAIMAQTWERLLWVSGGALNLKKCYWFAVAWKWTKTGEPTMMTIAENPDLEIRLTKGSNHNVTSPITRVEVTEGTRTLGARLCPAGSDKAELAHRIDHGKKLRQRLQKAPTNKEETRIGFGMYRQAVEYVLPTTCFTQPECLKIQRTFLPTFLSKMGIRRSTAEAIRSGPLRFGGMDEPEVWTVQGSGHDKMLIGSLRKDDVVGQTLNVELDLLQLQAGVSWDVLSRPGETVRHYVPACWAVHTWDFNDSCGITVARDAQPWLLPQRRHDKFIMEEIAALPNIKPLALKYAQRCRLYLGVTTLADISTSDGKALSNWALQHGTTNPRPTSLLYPNQILPNTTVWNIFTALLHQCFTDGTNGTLTQPMEQWYKGRLTQVWYQVYSPATKKVYSYEQGSVREYIKRRPTQTRFTYYKRSTTTTFPLDAIPISGRFEAGHFIPDARHQPSFIDPPTPTDTTAEKMTRTLHGVEFIVDIVEVAYALWTGDAIITTDGSVQNDNGTYGIAILIHLSSPEPTLAVRLGGHIPALAEFLDMDSHRPEAAALLVSMFLVGTIMTQCPQPIGPMPNNVNLRFYLDNKSVTTDIDWHFNEESSVFDYLKADYDIVQGIQKLQSNLPLPASVSWVKGHQDRHLDWDELSNAAKGNCHADNVCTEVHSKNVNDVGLFPEWVPGTPAALLHNGRFISKRLDTYVRTAATAERSKTYLIDKSDHRDPELPAKWTDEIFNNVDWRTHGASIKAQPKGRQLQISKFVNDKAPTKKFLSIFDNSVDSRCFACNTFNETPNHVLRCNSLLRAKTRKRALGVFLDHLTRYHTPKPMADALLTTMKRWLQNLPYQTPTFVLSDDDPLDQRLQTSLETAFQKQNDIGWAHFFRGRLTKAWKDVIALYYKERQPDEPHNPTLWMRKTVDQLWEFYIAIWYCRNGELHGHDFEEQKKIALEATRTTVRRVYQETSDTVEPHHARILHHMPVEEILKWTKTHLDAYLATAEVILEQNVDPG